VTGKWGRKFLQTGTSDRVSFLACFHGVGWILRGLTGGWLRLDGEIFGSQDGVRMATGELNDQLHFRKVKAGNVIC